MEPAPYVRVISQRLVTPREAATGSSVVIATAATAATAAAARTEASATTQLSPSDQITVMTATCRAWGFPGGFPASHGAFNEAALEAALAQTLSDLPFLAGRLSKMQGMRLASLHIKHTNEGALLTVAEAPTITVEAAMGPSSWPRRSVTVPNPALPFYVDQLDPTRRALLRGKEPLMKVRLTRVADGAILSVTLCHVITDGVRWPALMAHLAARYRQSATGKLPDPQHLLKPSDRTLLSSSHMKGLLSEVMGGVDASPAAALKRPPFKVRSSFAGWLRLTAQVLAPRRYLLELAILHIPKAEVANLKRLAAESNPDSPAITTGDAVQAACILLIHAARGRPLLPVAPQKAMVMVQLPAPAGYFGNAVCMLEVSLPVGTPQPTTTNWRAALSQLAGAIRSATAAFRTQPTRVLEALEETEALVAAPALRMLSFVSGKLLPQLTAATNYMPASQDLDLGLGAPSAYSQQLSLPRARDMAIIRGAVTPLSAGLIAQLALAPGDAQRLREHPLLAQLVPSARWVGGGHGNSAK
ncbi:hypothetical protein D9Q98_004859 [Chlorella vulgaris]|uniref:Uncharacterized protein n=1 Tax=Chlorella vulgaris TaxID=3077 RepID=A0A9D4TN69_CHLVU|nr:hypothetical protein D9Q98_004859 [Chlorella vulgaris]